MRIVQMRALGPFLRKLVGDESGQSIVVVVSSMTVLLGVAAFGIDAANWMVRHHQAQVVADSAALAAAHCLANPGQSGGTIVLSGVKTTVPGCTSNTDTADADQVAVDYAAANGLTITSSNVTIADHTVKVTAPASSSGVFSTVAGIKTTSQSAGAGASWTNTSGVCSNPGTGCDFMFANSSNCSTGSYVLIVSNQGASTINGNIQTNGSIEASQTGNGGGIYGSGTYGPGSCTVDDTGNQNPWKTSTPTQASSTISWPIDYSADFPACVVGGSANPCSTNSKTDGYPSFCTVAGTSIVLGSSLNGGMPQPGNIYCASGTGTKSDPSTWNGSISISTSGNNTFSDSFVGGTISYSGAGGDTISACGWSLTGYSSSTCSAPAPAGGTANYPVFYAVGTDPNPSSCATNTNVSTSCAFSVSSNGNLKLDGDVFVQNGTSSLNLQGNQSAGDTFIESNVISATLAGNFNGDGPNTAGGGGSGAGSVSLVQ